jgi:hypothetical protein
MKTPITIEDLEKYILNEIQENIHLDYKASPALSKKKRDEICKDISAFANSDGGVVIYGIEEVNALPTSLDSGVDTSKINREWIEQILTTNISPEIPGIEIVEIKIDPQYSYFVLKIPKSHNAPHQAPDNKYYKRYNFMSSPMEHYEIEDIRNRSINIPSLVDFNVELNGHLMKLVVENIGEIVARDVTFEFSEGFKWYRGEFPKALKEGIKFLPPRRKIAYVIGTSFTILSEKSEHPTSFDVKISYKHPSINSIYAENIHIDLKDFLGSALPANELKDIAKSLEEISKFKNELQRISNDLNSLSRISGASGLDLSLTTFKNFKHISDRSL